MKGEKGGKSEKGKGRGQKAEKMLEVNLRPCRAYAPEGGLRQELDKANEYCLQP